MKTCVKSKFPLDFLIEEEKNRVKKHTNGKLTHCICYDYDMIPELKINSNQVVMLWSFFSLGNSRT